MKTMLLVALAVPLASGPEAVPLVARPARGDVFQERERFWSSASGSAQDDAANRPSFGWGEAPTRRAGDGGTLLAREITLEDEVLEVRDGARVKVRRTFVTSRTTRAEVEEGEVVPQRQSALFEGQSVVLLSEGADTRLVGELDGEDELAPSDLDLSPRWELALPRSEVEVGDTWSLPAEVAARLLEPLAPRKAAGWCKLMGVEASESGPVARVQLELHGTASDSLGTTEIESSGHVLWDVDQGHLIEVTLAGETRTTDREGAESKRRFGLRHETRRLE